MGCGYTSTGQRHSGATTYKLNTMDKDLLGEEPAGEPPSRTLVSCLGRHRPYAAKVNPIERVRLKTRSIAEEVIDLAFFFFRYSFHATKTKKKAA